MRIKTWWTLINILLVVNSSSGGALQFANMIRSITTLQARNLMGYGNFCGAGGRGEPLDNLDRCCEAHDRCLKRANGFSCFPLFKIAFYIIPYIYVINDGTIRCGAFNSICQRALCECDRIAAECFREFDDEYDISLKRG